MTERGLITKINPIDDACDYKELSMTSEFVELIFDNIYKLKLLYRESVPIVYKDKIIGVIEKVREDKIYTYIYEKYFKEYFESNSEYFLSKDKYTYYIDKKYLILRPKYVLTRDGYTYYIAGFEIALEE